MSTVYILSEQNSNNIWGVYNSDIFLENMIHTLKINDPEIQLKIEEKIINTNITKKEIENPTFKKNKLIVEDKNCSNEKSSKDKEIISNEVKKVEELYETFLQDIKSYEKLLVEKLEVPDFFKNKFNVIQNIFENKMEEKERFSYYMSNIYLR